MKAAELAFYTIENVTFVAFKPRMAQTRAKTASVLVFTWPRRCSATLATRYVEVTSQPSACSEAQDADQVRRSCNEETSLAHHRA